MIVIEGPDMVGKTTLAYQLIEELNRRSKVVYHYNHLGLLDNTWDHYWSYQPYFQHYTVQDRFFLSEVVYGNVCRKGSKVDAELQRLLEADLARVAGVTVILFASKTQFFHDQWEKLKAREDFDLRKIETVNTVYMGAYLKQADAFYDLSRGWWTAGFVAMICDMHTRRMNVLQDVLRRGLSSRGEAVNVNIA